MVVTWELPPQGWTVHALDASDEGRVVQVFLPWHPGPFPRETVVNLQRPFAVVP